MGKVIAITGGGDGLGRALARRLAANGDSVILLGRTEEKVASVAAELGEPHVALQCDVSDPLSVQAAFAAIATRHSRIDVLVNNAAVNEPFTLAEADPAKVRLQLETNLAGPIYCAHEALPLLRGGGHIINLTSDSVSQKIAMMWSYGGTKAGLEFVSEAWMRELEAEGVRVTIARCGHMTDDTKAGMGWPAETAERFGRENARIGIHFDHYEISRYDSVAECLRGIIELPGDIQVKMIWLGPLPSPVAPETASRKSARLLRRAIGGTARRLRIVSVRLHGKR